MSMIKVSAMTVLVMLCASVQITSAELLTGLTGGSTLITFDSATPEIVSGPRPITGLGTDSIIAIDRRPATGQLYGLGGASTLYIIDSATGAATQVGISGAFTLNGTSFGFDFNPTVDRIRVTSNTGQNLRLNPNDGSLTSTDSPLVMPPAIRTSVRPRVSSVPHTRTILLRRSDHPL
jgi:hypothetical protein